MSIYTSIVDVAIHVDTMIKHVIKLSVEMSNYCSKSVLHIKWKTVGTISKSNKKIVETETKSISLTHMYMTAHLTHMYMTAHLTHMYMAAHLTHMYMAAHLTHMYMTAHLAHMYMTIYLAHM